MTWWDKTKEKANKTLINAHNAAFGPLTSSKFLTEGVLTPEEFVQAGDLLVYKCPTWSWESGDPAKAVPYLPKDKQFLITRKVPCLMRATALEKSANEAQNQEIEIDGDEGWIETHVGYGKDESEIPEIPTEAEEAQKAEKDAAGDEPVAGGDEDEIPDMEEFAADDNLEDEDPSALATNDEDRDSDLILKTRTYDISITYDKYYQTPKVWLFGYDESGNGLTPKQVFMDISQDHAQKTVTIDTHPHMQTSCAYIHPCKHSAVMKKIILRQSECGKEPRVDQYLFLFLKFLSAVIPTIEYDYTMEIES
jgi:ubiquitin-like-conjugating enzyme ATG3